MKSNNEKTLQSDSKTSNNNKQHQHKRKITNKNNAPYNNNLWKQKYALVMWTKSKVQQIMTNSQNYLLAIVDKVPISIESWTNSNEESKSMPCMSVDIIPENFNQPSNYIQLPSYSAISYLTKEKTIQNNQNKLITFEKN